MQSAARLMYSASLARTQIPDLSGSQVDGRAISRILINLQGIFQSFNRDICIYQLFLEE